MVTVHGIVTSPGWIISPVHADGLSPAQYKVVCVLFGLVPAQFCSGSSPFKNLQKKNTFSKTSMIFSHIFLSILINIGLFFIYCKNTNPILKYSVFVKKKFFFCFVHTAQSLKAKKKSYCIFIQQRKLQTIYFSMHFGFSNQFIKVTGSWSIFQKQIKKYIYFLF